MRSDLGAAFSFNTKLSQDPRMVHQQKGAPSGPQGLARAHAPRSGAHEDRGPASFIQAGVNAATIGTGGVIATNGGAAPFHPMLRGLPLTEEYSPSFAYVAMSGWAPALERWYTQPYYHPWDGQGMIWGSARTAPGSTDSRSRRSHREGEYSRQKG